MTNYFRPTYAFNSVSDVPVAELRERHPYLEAISWDLDRCLAEHGELSIPEEHLAKLEEIAREGLALAIISNAHSEEKSHRAHRVGENISAKIGREIVVATSFEAGRRKPFRPIFELAARELELPPISIIHGGDQIWRDVVGSNHADYAGSILVAPYGSSDGEAWAVKKLQRPAERLVSFVFPPKYKNTGP